MFYHASIASVANLIAMTSTIITMPVLAKSLGIELFGKYIFILAISAFLVLIVDYGFNISSTKEISIARGDIKLRSKIFFETFFCKMILLTVSFVIIFLLTIFVDEFSILQYEVLLGFLYVTGFSMSPIWYYYGVEKITQISLITMISRLTAIPLVIIFVQDAGDFQLSLMIYASTGVMIGFLSILYLHNKKELVWILVKPVDIVLRLKFSFNLFVALFMVGLYTSINSLLIGLVSTPSEVSKYAVVEKIVKTIEGILATIALTIFPKISLMQSLDKKKSINVIYDIARVLVGLSIIIATALFFYGQSAITLLFGDEFSNIDLQIQIMAMVMVLGIFSIVFGNLGLINLAKRKYFTRVLVVSGVIHVPMVLFLSFKYGSLGAVIATTLSALFVASGMWFYWYQKVAKFVN